MESTVRDAPFKQVTWVSHSCKQVLPECNLRLAGTVAYGFKELGKLLDKLHYTRKKGIWEREGNGEGGREGKGEKGMGREGKGEKGTGREGKEWGGRERERKEWGGRERNGEGGKGRERNGEGGKGRERNGEGGKERNGEGGKGIGGKDEESSLELYTWDRHRPRSLFLKNLVEHQFQDVGEVGKVREVVRYLKGMTPKTKERNKQINNNSNNNNLLSSQKLSQNVMQKNVCLQGKVVVTPWRVIT